MFKFTSTRVSLCLGLVCQAAFFFTTLSSFLSFLIFFSIFLTWLGILGVAGLRLGASNVLRQLALPHQQGYSALSLGV